MLKIVVFADSQTEGRNWVRYLLEIYQWHEKISLANEILFSPVNCDSLEISIVKPDQYSCGLRAHIVIYDEYIDHIILDKIIMPTVNIKLENGINQYYTQNSDTQPLKDYIDKYIKENINE